MSTNSIHTNHYDGKPPTAANTLPVLGLWWRDFFGSLRVQALCGVLRGLYLTLLVLEWAARGEGLPADDKRLRKILGVDEAVFAKVKAEVLSEFFTERDGRLFNERLEAELEKALQQKQVYVERARKAANVRHATSNRQACHPSPSPSPSPSSKKSPSDSRRSEIDWSECLEVWNRLAEKIGAPKVRGLNAQRKKALQTRLKDDPGFWERIAEAFGQLSEWAIQKGFITLDWVLKSTNYAKLVEGNFKDKDREKSEDLSAWVREVEESGR